MRGHEWAYKYPTTPLPVETDAERKAGHVVDPVSGMQAPAARIGNMVIMEMRVAWGERLRPEGPDLVSDISAKVSLLRLSVVELWCGL